VCEPQPLSAVGYRTSFLDTEYLIFGELNSRDQDSQRVEPSPPHCELPLLLYEHALKASPRTHIIPRSVCQYVAQIYFRAWGTRPLREMGDTAQQILHYTITHATQRTLTTRSRRRRHRATGCSLSPPPPPPPPPRPRPRGWRTFNFLRHTAKLRTVVLEPKKPLALRRGAPCTMDPLFPRTRVPAQALENIAYPPHFKTTLTRCRQHSDQFGGALPEPETNNVQSPDDCSTPETCRACYRGTSWGVFVPPPPLSICRSRRIMAYPIR